MSNTSHVSAFTVCIGQVDGKPAVIVVSTDSPNTIIHAMDAANARMVAKNLNACADMLDPPKPEWRVIETTDDLIKNADPAVLAKNIVRMARGAVKKAAKRKR